MLFETFLRTLRISVRALWKSPGRSLIAILSLAFGTGASLTMFGAIEALLLRRCR
jgi:hypothetical protein